MTLEQFLLENLWGIVVGAIGLAFTVGTVYMAVKISLKQVTNKVDQLGVDMQNRDSAHDETLEKHEGRLSDLEKKTAVLDSRMDQTIRHIGEQLERIHNKLFGS